MARLSHRAATELLTDLRHDVVDASMADWDGWMRRLSLLDGRDWLLLDKRARRSTWAEPALMSGTRGWEGLDLDHVQAPLIVAMAMHVDGRLRERATRVLGIHGGQVASAVLALRLLDHVPAIAEAALRVVSAPPPGLEIDVVADVLLNGAVRQVGAERWSWLVDALGVDSPEMLELLRLSSYRVARRWAVQKSLLEHLLEPAEVIEIASGDPDQWLRRAAAEHLASAQAPEHLAPLLAAGSVEARLTAVTTVPEGLLDNAALERLLLDRAPRVREQARWRARRRGVNVAAVCRRHLDDRMPGAVAAALDGLAWVGDESDVPAVVRLLHHPAPKVRAAAVRTYAARVTGRPLVERLGPCLEDPAGRVSNAAAVVLARAGAPAEVATQAWASPLPTVRRAAWRVSRAPGGWQRVAADLRAATDDDPNLGGLGRDGVRGWLMNGAATTWGRPDPGDAAAMERHLAESGLREDEREHVAFHAGLPFERRAFESAEAPASASTRRSPKAPRRGIRRWFGRGGT